MTVRPNAPSGSHRGVEDPARPPAPERPVVVEPAKKGFGGVDRLDVGGPSRLQTGRAAMTPQRNIPTRTFIDAVHFLARHGSVAMLVAGNGTKLGLDPRRLAATSQIAGKVCRFFARGERFNIVGGGDQLQRDDEKHDISNARQAIVESLNHLGSQLLAFQADPVEGTAWDVTDENTGGVCYVPCFTRDGSRTHDPADVVWGGRTVVDGEEILHGATWGYLNRTLTQALGAGAPVTEAQVRAALAGNAAALPRYGIIAIGGGPITFDELDIALARGLLAFYLPAEPRATSRNKDGTVVPNPASVKPGYRGETDVKVAEKLRTGSWLAVPAAELGIAESQGYFLVRADASNDG